MSCLRGVRCNTVSQRDGDREARRCGNDIGCVFVQFRFIGYGLCVNDMDWV